MASMFTGASNVCVNGGTFNVTNNHPDEKLLMTNMALKDLSKAASENALHDSATRYDAPKCHPNTRTAVLDLIEEFVQRSEEMQSSLLWLYGGAGAGKSAIVQSIAERCIPQGLVLGCFFFSRTDSTRNSATGLIPTLAYQLARAFPAIMAVIEGIITSDPLIFSSSLKKQAYELLVRPLQHLVNHGVLTTAPSSPRAFLIDGLDECNDPKMQTAVIDVTVELLLEFSLPVVFLVASRPEQHIVAAFSALSFPYKSIPLSDHIDSEADIRRYIKDTFHDISLRHPFKDQIPASWPPSTTVDELVLKSSSHFIYAATAMKYIMAPHDSPLHSLQVVLGLQAPRNTKQMPFSDLDALYMHILSSATYRDASLAILAQCLLAGGLTNSVAEIAFVLGYKPSDIYIFIADLQALVTTVNDGDSVHVYLRHASLGDFLLDKSRALSLHVDHHAYHARYVARYFELFDLAAQKESDEHILYHEIISPVNVRYTRDKSSKLIEAIEYSMGWVEVTPDSGIVQLFWHHSPSDIWHFCSSFHLNVELVVDSILRYMRLIQNLVIQDNDRLYGHHLAIYVSISHLILQSSGNALSEIALPLFFSGFSILLLKELFVTFPDDHVCELLVSHLDYKHESPMAERRMKIASTAYRQLTSTVKLTAVAQSLLTGLRSSHRYLVHIHQTPHERWLQRKKPFKFVTSRPPRLARRRLQSLWILLRSHPVHPYTYNAVPPPDSSKDKIHLVWNTRRCYPLLLNALVHVLSLADPSDQLAELTRKMLPRAALQYRVPMRRARRAMDAYTERVYHTNLALVEDQIDKGDHLPFLLQAHMQRNRHSWLNY